MRGVDIGSASGRAVERKDAMTDQPDYVPFDDAIVDFAVVAFQEDGRWEAVPLPPHVAETLDLFVAALRQQGSDGPTIGLLGIDDDYFVAARLVGPDVRLFLSSRAAGEDDRLAGDVLSRLGGAADEWDSARGPVGDQEIFADLGVGSFDLQVVCERLRTEGELGLIDAVEGLAARIGFGEQFARSAWSAGEAVDEF
jgi:putative tRNA adenosine deaminase-associated protein